MDLRRYLTVVAQWKGARWKGSIRVWGIVGAAVLALAGIAWVALPAAAVELTYQAEDAALSGGAVAQTEHPGYTGSGFVGGYTDGNKGAAATTFTVTTPRAGGYRLSLRYANGTTAPMSLSLYVNGIRARQIGLPAVGNWDTWGDSVEPVALPAGTSTVAYRFDWSDRGNVNVDSLTLTQVPPSPPGTYEAEWASLAGGAVVATEHREYAGLGFVAGYTDGNKGRAVTTFTVGADRAGPASVIARYANGTGVPMTLSIYVNGAKVGQTTFPGLSNWDTWSTKSESLTLVQGSNTIAYRFDATDSGNINLDQIVVTPARSTELAPSSSAPSAPSIPSSITTDTAPSGAESYELETAFLSGGTSTATAVGGFTGTGYVTGFTTNGARVIRTVNVAQAANRTVTVRYANETGATRTLTIVVNGLTTGQLKLPAGGGWQTSSTSVAVRAGLNLIAIEYRAGDSGTVSLDSVTVGGGTALAGRGATVPFTTYEAEAGSTNGTILAADRAYLTEAAEASGRRAVRLTETGQYVQFTLTRPANAIVVRYSIPDNAAGTGITAPLALYAGADKVRDLSLTSTYSWVYGAYPYNNNPAGGEAHHFFDDTRAMLPRYPAGTVLKLQKDATSTAASYLIDLIETEEVAPATSMPADYLPVTSFGAVANDAGDDTGAFNSAIAAAKTQHKGVWVPAGSFTINTRLSVAGVSIRGAGQWHSTIHGTNGKGGFFGTGSDIELADLTFSGDVRFRDDNNFDAAIEGDFGTGSLIHQVWLEHAKVGMWISSGTNGLYAVGLRVRNMFADGVNLNNNVANTRVDQSVLRNTGDDALAMWSHSAAVTNSAFTFNSAALPMLANPAAIYGGNGNRIEDNLFSDTVYAGAGIAISTWHEAQPFSGTTTVARNTLTRTSGYERNWQTSLGALWIYAEAKDITAPVVVRDLDIVDSTYQAILLSFQRTIDQLTLDHVTVRGAGTYGIELNAAGKATFSYVTVTGTGSGGLVNRSNYNLVRGAGNSGF